MDSIELGVSKHLVYSETVNEVFDTRTLLEPRGGARAPGNSEEVIISVASGFKIDSERSGYGRKRGWG